MGAKKFYYVNEITENFTPTTIVDGSRYYLPQSPKDPSWLGSKFIVVHMNFHEKSGEYRAQKPTLVGYVEVTVWKETFIHLKYLQEDRDVCNDYWSRTCHTVFKESSAEQALEYYNNRVQEFKDKRSALLYAAAEKELKSIEKLKAKLVI